MMRPPTSEEHPDRAASHTDGSSTNHAVLRLAHGGGGQLTDQLLDASILAHLTNPALDLLLDAGLVDFPAQGRLALTLDGYVVEPWTFPGGDIGRLAICGTVNDLAVCGARPLAIALGVIAAEGFHQRDLETVMRSVAAAAREAHVDVVTGDTKVVGRNSADGIYLTTAGVGVVPQGLILSPSRIRPGDVILLSGAIGEHGLAVMLAREMPDVQSVIRSDVAPLNDLIEHMIERIGDDAVFLRDPTRSGLAGVAADIAATANRHVILDEQRIPIHAEAEHAAEMLGLDLLEIANEGKVVAVVRPDAARPALEIMQSHPLGRDASIIGRVTDQPDGLCEIETTIGGRRIVQKPYGEQLPRIC